MDGQKRVRVLVQDPKTYELSLLTTNDLCKKDRESLKQNSFDEFGISPGIIHWHNKAMYMLENKAKDNATW